MNRDPRWGARRHPFSLATSLLWVACGPWGEVPQARHPLTSVQTWPPGPSLKVGMKCRAIGELGVTVWAASCPPIPCPGSPSPHRKPLETFRETVRPGRPIRVLNLRCPQALAHCPREGPLSSLASRVGWGWGSGRVSTRGPDLLLRLGVGRKKNGGSSKEQLDSLVGGGYHGM